MSKNTWPCPGKPEDLKGQPIGMYHCEFCGEMQLAGVPHLAPQFPSQWEEPFPKVEEPPDYGPGDDEPEPPSTTCPACGAPDSVTFTREEARFPYGVAPQTVELSAIVDKGRCSCAFEFTDWRAELAHTEAVKIHLATTATSPGTVTIMLGGDMTGQTHIGYRRNDAEIFHTIARAPGGAVFTIGDHFDTCSICKGHNVTLNDFHAFMRGHAS